MRAEYLLLGEILRPQGIKGEVKLKHYTDDPNLFASLETVFLKRGDAYVPMGVLSARRLKDDVFLTLEGVCDRDQAEALRGGMLYVDRAHARELSDGEVFIADILGAKVLTKSGEALGALVDVFPAGGADVYRVKTPSGSHMMFPALSTVLLSLDADAGVVIVDETVLQEVAVYEDRDTDHLS